MADTGRASAEHREERKVVTAVFADLVGSTALAERLDPEEVKLIVGEAVARMVHAVEEFGGTVKDLAGDGVLALFGAPTAHEDDEERAVRASLRIVEEIEAYGTEVARGWGIEGFSVRVGVNTGPVVMGALGAGDRVEYTAFGDTVNTAARLQSAAEPGTVLVGAEVRRAVEPTFDWGEAAEHELKGKAEAVVAYPVRGAHAPAGRAAGLSAAVDLVGREQELETVGERLDEVLVGTGGIVFFTGEPGIGKTRLLRELRSRFEASPASGGRPLWIEGRCASYGESIPYWPFRDLLRSWLGVSTDDPELRVRVALRRRVEQLFEIRALEVYPYLASMLGLALEPDAADRLAELSPEALQYRTFEVTGTLLARLAEGGPVVVVIEDLHWADPTSVQLAERLLPVAEGSAVLLLATGRAERDHPFWAVKELAAREFPHRTRDLVLEPLSGDADRELLRALVGNAELPDDLERRILEAAGGNPFFLEELVSSFVDSGALVREDESWRFDHEVAVEIPPTVERVILARLDRLPRQSHELVVSASVLGRQFSLALLEGVSGDGELKERLHELQRLDLIREARRWPEPEYQFKHALIQEAAYRTMLAPRRKELHRKAAEWLERQYAEHEEEVYELLAHHWLQAEDEEKAIAYLTRAGDKARQEYALDEAIEHYRALLPLLEEHGKQQEAALVLFKLALALHMALRFREANAAYQRAFEHWTPPGGAVSPPTKTLRMAASYVPTNADPTFAGWWPDIQLCMQLFDRLVEAWPERTIVPALAERWEISEDGLQYVFHLREGLQWSDGEPLTAHDVEYGIKRVLTPDDPGGSVSVYFVLENAQDYFFGRNPDADRIGVRALDDRTVEFRLVAPAPYFMSVLNRPDGGPQPRHAVERHRERWAEPERQVVSGAFHVAESGPDRLVLARNENHGQPRTGNVATVEYLRVEADRAFPAFEQDELEMIRVMYTPRLADHVRTRASVGGPLTWFAYLGFDHRHPLLADVELRRALAYATDRDALATACPANLVVASGGVVPPALHGHTPEIAPRFDPGRAREHLQRSPVASGLDAQLAVCAHAAWQPMLASLVSSWKDVLALDVEIRLFKAGDERVEAEADTGTRAGVPLLAVAPIAVLGWLPGYPDPEYMLRLLLHSEALTNAGRYEDKRFDELIEQARRASTDRERLELFHEADRYAVADRVAVIPLVYGRSTAFVKPWVEGWWEFGKTSVSFADLVVDESSPQVDR